MMAADIFHMRWLLDSQNPLQCRHNDRDGVSNHLRLDGLLKRLFRRRSKKTSKLCVTGLCEGNSPVTDEFHSQRASNAENVSIWWRHHAHPSSHPSVCLACVQLAWSVMMKGMMVRWVWWYESSICKEIDGFWTSRLPITIFNTCSAIYVRTILLFVSVESACLYQERLSNTWLTFDTFIKDVKCV